MQRGILEEANDLGAQRGRIVGRDGGGEPRVARDVAQDLARPRAAALLVEHPLATAPSALAVVAAVVGPHHAASEAGLRSVIRNGRAGNAVAASDAPR